MVDDTTLYSLGLLGTPLKLWTFPSYSEVLGDPAVGWSLCQRQNLEAGEAVGLTQ